MYEDITEIKYIKVNGVEPPHATLADGSYPLLGYNYAVFSADEPEDSNVRAIVKWMQSDEGQQVIANAGYIPYRQVEVLTLPEPTSRKLYTAEATSGITQPERTADHYYLCNTLPDRFTTPGLDAAVQTFITEAEAELSQLDEAKMQAFIKSRAPHGYGPEFVTKKTLKNGYLSVIVGLRYNFGAQDSPDYYYDARTAVFDIFTGKRLDLSDLFFDSVDFVPLLNRCLANEAATSYSLMGAGLTHDMLHDFTGLYEGEYAFTADSIIFKPNTCFADGVELSISDLTEYMVTSSPRDMTGYVDADIPIYKTLRLYHSGMIGSAEEKNGITIWYLNSKKAHVSDEVCVKINAFIDNIYETHFTDEKLMAALTHKCITAQSVEIGPYPDFDVTLYGDRYIAFSGANVAYPKNSSVQSEFTVIEGHTNPYYFQYFFNAATGETLKIDDLFSDGWEDSASYYIYDENFNTWDSSTWTEYTAEIDISSRIFSISDYYSAPYRHGDLSDLDVPVAVYLTTENGDNVAVLVPREYIK